MLIEAVAMAEIEIITQPFYIITVLSMRHASLSNKSGKLIGKAWRNLDHVEISGFRLSLVIE